jgi:4-amino-4-deoxy-L-arabinose transferase
VSLSPFALRRPGISIALLFGLVYVAPLGVRPLLAPDELRYAEVAREMLSTGDWVVPHLNGLRYFEKPVLGYWLFAGSSALLGLRPFALRLPCVLATGLAALALYGLVRAERRREPELALLAAAIYLTSAEVFAVGVHLVVDSVLTGFVTGSLVAFYAGSRAAGSRRRLLFLAGALAGLGFLTKGLLALAIPVSVAVPFLFWEGRSTEVLRLGAWPLLGAVAVAAPWSIAIHLREPDFWRYFIVVEHLHRIGSSDAEHARPWWFLFPYLVGGVFPWTLAIPAAWAGLRRCAPDSLTRFACCWLIGPLVLLCASSGKIGTYVLPCFPAAAVLLALGLGESSQRDARGSRAAAWALFAVSAAPALALLLDRSLLRSDVLSRLLRDVRWPVLAAGLAGCGLVALPAARARPQSRLGWYAAASLPLLLATPWAIPIEEGRLMPQLFVSRRASQIPGDALVAADPRCLYAVALALGRDDLYVLRASELEYGLRDPEQAARLWAGDRLREVLLDPQRARAVVVIAERRRYEALRDAGLPKPDLVDLSRDLVFARFDARARDLDLLGASDGARASRDDLPGDGLCAGPIRVSERQLAERAQRDPGAPGALQELAEPARVDQALGLGVDREHLWRCGCDASEVVVGELGRRERTQELVGSRQRRRDLQELQGAAVHQRAEGKPSAAVARVREAEPIGDAKALRAALPARRGGRDRRMSENALEGIDRARIALADLARRHAPYAALPAGVIPAVDAELMARGLDGAELRRKRLADRLRGEERPGEQGAQAIEAQRSRADQLSDEAALEEAADREARAVRPERDEERGTDSGVREEREDGGYALLERAPVAHIDPETQLAHDRRRV